MITLKSIINEITDGRGNLTKEKFGGIVMSELIRIFPRFADIELLNTLDLQQEKDSAFSRADILNSDLMAIYSIEYNNKEYEVRVINSFKKVPDSELTDPFTMADDNTLRKMDYKSLEPKDLNKPSPLLIFKCRVVRIDDDKVLVPKKPGYAILFDTYRTLNEVVTDIKNVIEKDGGPSDGSSISPNIPKIPTKTPIPVHELFDSPYSTHKIPKEYSTDSLAFNADGESYVIYFYSTRRTARGWNASFDRRYDFKQLFVDTINIEFSKGDDVNISPTKHYLKVLATVLGEVMKKAEKCPDAILTFSSKIQEASRIKLYDRMIEKFAAHDYLLDTYELSGEKRYVLIPKSILNR